ncbi:MAG: long-chain fatty acid--CoA ligase [Pseudomonadota bacterium]|nr:long-chain fatty acid--CoA ligase [Pseudomonadota bacterium]
MSRSEGQYDAIPAAFRAVARERGAQPVILGAGPDWTFRDLDRASDGVAAALAQAGVGAGDRLGLYCLNSPQFALAYLAILKAGATVVPINLMLNPREIAFILDDAGAKALFYHADLAETAARARAETPGLAFAVRIGGGEADGDALLEDLVESGGQPPSPQIDPDEQLAAILYTSGTTGRPKGAMLTHRNLMANAASIVQALALSPGQDRMLVVLPMFHAFAATVGMLTPLVHGLSLVPVGRFDPKLVSAAIEDHQATVFLGVPSMYSLLLRLDAETLSQWRSVRYCVSGGAAMPRAVMAAFEERFGIPVLEGDGPTECSPVTCVTPLAGRRKPGSVGIPIPGVEMRIAAPDGTSREDGEHGEVCVRGPNVMKGYWGLPEETRQSFFENWFRTGDLGYRDADGYFFLVDRIKDLIITNGMNVYPRMIEEVLYRHPAVAEAAVVGEPHDLHGEIPLAFVVAKPGAEPEPAELREWCREHLGRHEIPRRILLRESLPKNAAGKILKRELRRHGELERGVDNPLTPGAGSES